MLWVRRVWAACPLAEVKDRYKKRYCLTALPRYPELRFHSSSPRNYRLDTAVSLVHGDAIARRFQSQRILILAGRCWAPPSRPNGKFPATAETHLGAVCSKSQKHCARLVVSQRHAGVDMD